MPKRQPKPEAMTIDEVMDSPALQGFDTFLRYRPNEDKSLPALPIQKLTGQDADIDANIPIGELPIGISNTTVTGSPAKATGILQLPIGETPMGNIREPDSPAPLIPSIHPPKKVRRAVRVQDAHSTGEQALYQALWNAGVLETPDSRLIRIGYGGMQSLCGLDKSNCKNNIGSLIKKLALEVMSGFDIRRNEGNTYRVYSYGAILKRRKAAGMEWVIRNRGVLFVKQPPIGELPIGGCQLPRGESPPGPVGEIPIGPMGETPIAYRKGRTSGELEGSSSLVWKALRPYCGVVDDDAVRTLVEKCRAVAADCTEEEIAGFIRVKAERGRANRQIHNLMGFLQVAVPKCFEGMPFQEFRAEQAQRRAAEQQQIETAEAEMARMLAEQKAILDDPNASEEDKRFARRILGISASPESPPGQD